MPAQITLYIHMRQFNEAIRTACLCAALCTAAVSSAAAKGSQDSTKSGNTGAPAAQPAFQDAPGMMPPGAPQQDIPLTGALELSGSERTQTVQSQTVTSSSADQNAVLVQNGAMLTIAGSQIIKTGDTSSADQSNFTGLNAGILAAAKGRIQLTDTEIRTDADGANAVFATGKGSHITVKNIRITTSGNSSRGLDATYDGTIEAEQADITTRGAHCAGLATDRGEGTVTLKGGTIRTAGDGSPVIYSTGTITAVNVTGTATGAEIAAVEGKNSITLDSCSLTGAGPHGIMLYQSFSGDASTGTASFTARNSTLTTTSHGPFFYITNTNAKARLENTKLEFDSGILVQVSGNSGERGWGRPGSNGGSFELTLDGQQASGNIVCDAISTMTLNLENGSSFTGAINTARQGAAGIKIAENAVWSVTADSYIGSFIDSDTSYRNIHTNGHTVYYDKTEPQNLYLGSKTIDLPDGGRLVPYTAQRAAAVRTADTSKDRAAPAPAVTVTGIISVSGSDANAVTLLTASDGTVYTIRQDMQPAGMQPKGKLKGGPAGSPAGEQGRPPEPPAGTGAGGMQGMPPDGGPGGMTPPAKHKTVTTLELQKLAGRTLTCKGMVRSGAGGKKEFTVFEYTVN